MKYSHQQSNNTVQKVIVPELAGRRRFILACFMLMMCVLIYRAIDLQVLNNSYLQKRGEAVHLRDIKLPAYRGKITDVGGHALAISAPVSSVWVNPQELELGTKKKEFAKLLGLKVSALDKKLKKVASRRFVYLRRHMDPQVTAMIDQLQLPGVYLQKEYRRYYPDGEVAAHLVGFTNIDDEGQEGLELAWDESLKGSAGAERVLRDGKRRMVKHVDNIRAPIPGQDIRLTIDRRLQYLAYRELKAAVAQQKATSGSLVLLNAETGQLLAVANQPAFNPNDRSKIKASHVRNRAFVDLFEPGSTMKPFTVAAGMESGVFDASTVIDTNPGYMRVGRSQVRDHRNYGEIDLATLLLKSSNVASAKIALGIPGEKLWGMLNSLGFGQSAGLGFPGEARGKLVGYEQWRPIETATLSFGYGLSTSALQLARAYSVIANEGVLEPVSLVVDEAAAESVRVMSPTVANSVRNMMRGVVTKAGTAPRAKVYGYSVAGKTGTVKKAIAGGYAEDKYLGVFAGMAPASDPKLVMVVVIDEPKAGDYYGGLVAAPVFSRVMSGALRLMNIAPDNLDKATVFASLERGIQ
ncbi:penicillin-binding protein 2 [Cycloclasticus sp.]|uniref:peptidoglycan D,D-transpeptidase FtsI family protein n=1 Tax=Cycloclasticus sp. TaxID=2024830 RepID=UPI000C0C7E5F|nr:penicillin-binding protein 2 [Cycloclasticus sp.]PHR51602.1 MAG: cell division protein [Cycloclasticus sp.]